LSSLLDDFDKKLGDDPLDDEFDVDPDLLPDLNDYERPTPTDAELFGPAPMGSFVPPGKKEIVRKPLTLPPRTPRQVVIPSVVTPKTPTRPLPVFPQQGGSTCPPGGKTPCQGSATPCPPPTNRAATAGGGFF
jgi:hypothetical protein